MGSSNYLTQNQKMFATVEEVTAETSRAAVSAVSECG